MQGPSVNLLNIFYQLKCSYDGLAVCAHIQQHIIIEQKVRFFIFELMLQRKDYFQMRKNNSSFLTKFYEQGMVGDI